MSKFNSPLNNIKVASPCPANWDAMYGDNRKRFCGECKLNVYNLSGMSRDDAERLVRNAEGRLCVRYFQRADGTVITEDCPVGWSKIKAKTRVYVTAAFSMIMALFTGMLFASVFSKRSEIGGDLRIPFVTPTPMRTMGAVEFKPNSMASNGPVQPIMGQMLIAPQHDSKRKDKSIK